jgi:hypothetical protein
MSASICLDRVDNSTRRTGHYTGANGGVSLLKFNVCNKVNTDVCV